MRTLRSADPAGADANSVSFVVEHPGRERELKFVVDSATFKAAQALPLLGEPAARPAWRRLKTTYFDTEAGDLRRNGVCLRVRRARGGFVMGLKWSPDSNRSLFERGEVEVKMGSAEPNLALLDEDMAANIARVIGDRTLTQVFVADIRRSARTVEIADSTIEIAFDQGFLVAGERREPVNEIELELKAGEPAALYRFGLAIVDALPVTLGVRSKADRGAQLLSPEPPAPVKAIAPAIGPETSLDDAIGVLMRNCLAQFTGNWPVAALGDAKEAVHQMRVSMRRLRAALGLFRSVFPCAELEGYRAEAKRIATALGEARDWDVFMDLARSGPFAHYEETPGSVALLAAAQSKADAGHAAALALLSEKSTTRFVLSMEAFVASRGWRNAVALDHLLWLSEPVTRFAARSLEQTDRKMRKRGRRFASLTPEARHALRISLKRVRYAADFFGRLFRPPSAVRRYARKLAALQDMLGQYNDAIIASRMVSRLDISANADLAHAAGVVVGWCGRSSLSDEDALRSAWRSLAKAERYWREDFDQPDLGASA
jgi:triphosphatase